MASFLRVVDKEDLKRNIEKCWKCVTSKTFQSNLNASNMPEKDEKIPLMAVVIQKLEIY